jgi:hypothetical protein
MPASGPLGSLGPAARWCVLAGLVDATVEVPDPLAFAQEAEILIAEGLAPIALKGLQSHSDWREQPLAGAFYNVTMNSHLRSMAADNMGALLIAEIEKAGIPVAVIKGPALARLHPNGWPRSYSDIDVLVPMRQFDRAVACILDQAFEFSERSVPQWRWFDSVCREGINLHGPKGGNIDVHHHVPPWSLGSSLHVQGVIRRAEPWALCGVPVQVASPEDQMLIAALHVLNDLWKGKLGLTSWRDLLVLMGRLGPERAAEAFARDNLAWLFELMTVALEAGLPESGVRVVRPVARHRSRHRLRIAALGWNESTAISRHRLSWATRLPMPNAVAFLVGTAVPAPSYIRQRHGTYRNYWKEAWTESIATGKGVDYRMTTVDDKERFG